MTETAPDRAAALADYRAAISHWHQAVPSDHASRWPRVESARRIIVQLGLRLEADEIAREVARSHGRIRL